MGGGATFAVKGLFDFGPGDVGGEPISGFGSGGISSESFVLRSGGEFP